MSNLPLEEQHKPVQGTPVKKSTPLKEVNNGGLQSPLVNTPDREYTVFQESPMSFTPIRGSNLSGIEPRKLKTSLLKTSDNLEHACPM